jgi:choline dehydrogenase-like flavoprotein
VTPFDYVIVGAGPAGCVLAGRLSADPATEDNELGASHLRGAGGPLHVSTADQADPLLEDVITAGTALGWQRAWDLNETDEETHRLCDGDHPRRRPRLAGALRDAPARRGRLRTAHHGFWEPERAGQRPGLASGRGRASSCPASR